MVDGRLERHLTQVAMGEMADLRGEFLRRVGSTCNTLRRQDRRVRVHHIRFALKRHASECVHPSPCRASVRCPTAATSAAATFTAGGALRRWW